MNSNERNYISNGTKDKARAFDEMKALWTLWGKSEEWLGLLRTVSSTSVDPDVGLLRRWENRLVLPSPPSPFTPEPDERTPNGWFEARFPGEADRWGKPFLQKQLMDRDTLPRTQLVAINEDFFAGVLGGDKTLGHQVIFYEPEKTFYFYDPAREAFAPTSEAKLKLLASHYMIQCAQSMSTLVDVEPIYGPFRSDKCLKGIVGRAKAMHAAGVDFFTDQKNTRLDAPAKDLLPKLFVSEGITVQPKAVLTVNEAFEGHRHWAKTRGLTPLQRREFKSLVAEVISEQFGVGLRHDLHEADGGTSKGWSGLAIRGDILLAN